MFPVFVAITQLAGGRRRAPRAQLPAALVFIPTLTPQDASVVAVRGV
jgi:hypothetical protein